VRIAPRVQTTASVAAATDREVTCRFMDSAAAGDDVRAEFFDFYRSLAAYERALGSGGTTMIVSPDSDFFRYFGNMPAQ
jgi:regulator of protease activity HflC (stomatin/prohibitin superfamily)